MPRSTPGTYRQARMHTRASPNSSPASTGAIRTTPHPTHHPSALHHNPIGGSRLRPGANPLPRVPTSQHDLRLVGATPPAMRSRRVARRSERNERRRTSHHCSCRQHQYRSVALELGWADVAERRVHSLSVVENLDVVEQLPLRFNRLSKGGIPFRTSLSSKISTCQNC